IDLLSLNPIFQISHPLSSQNLLRHIYNFLCAAYVPQSYLRGGLDAAPLKMLHPLLFHLFLHHLVMHLHHPIHLHHHLVQPLFLGIGWGMGHLLHHPHHLLHHAHHAFIHPAHHAFTHHPLPVHHVVPTHHATWIFCLFLFICHGRNCNERNQKKRCNNC